MPFMNISTYRCHHPIKILYIISTLTLGGAERFLIDLINNLDRSTFSTTLFFTRHLGRMGEKFLRKDVQVRGINRKSFIHFYMLFNLLRHVRSHHYDIIHCTLFGSCVWGGIIGRLTNTPVVIYQEHAANWPKKGLQKYIKRLITKFCDKLICVSDFEKTANIKYDKVPETKLSTIYNGIDIEAFSRIGRSAREIKQELKIDSNIPVVGLVGRLVNQKAQDIFLKAAKIALVEKTPIIFVLIGDGPEEQNLRELSSQLGLDEYVKFLGYKENISELISILDIAVLCSRAESFPITLLEYMALSKPIIATAVGDVPKMIKNNEDGILIAKPEPHEFALKILELLNNKELAFRLGQKAFENVSQNFLLYKMINSYQALYLNLIKEKRQNWI